MVNKIYIFLKQRLRTSEPIAIYNDLNADWSIFCTSSILK